MFIYCFHIYSFYYMKNLFGSLLNSQNIDFMQDLNLVHRTVFIDDLNISATKFNLTDVDKKNLTASGKEGAIKYFEYKEKMKVAIKKNLI